MFERETGRLTLLISQEQDTGMFIEVMSEGTLFVQRTISFRYLQCLSFFFHLVYEPVSSIDILKYMRLCMPGKPAQRQSSDTSR